MPAAVPVVAAESVLAAEVMAAEAAAAAAAEAAAIEAAQIAAAEAASQAAATAAAEQAATAAATEAATTAGTTGIEALNLGQASGFPTGIETINPAFQQGMLTPEQISAYTNGIPTAGPATQVAQAPITDAGLQRVYDAVPKSVVEQALTKAPEAAAQVAPEASKTMLDYGMARPTDMGGASGMNAPLSNTTPSQYSLGNQMADYKLAGSVPSPAATQTATAEPGFFDKALNYIKDNKLSSASMGLNALQLFNKKKGPEEKEKYSGPLSKFKFDPDVYQPYEPQPPTPYQPRMYNYAGGGPVEMMSNANAIGANTGYPMADINKGAYATPYQTPISRNVITGASDTGVNPMTGEMQFAGGGISSLGGYSDYARGGRMLKGPGDGMSDDIPATIANKQPARLANEEFVVPADVVSHLGNGSSEAGAKALYKMMDRVRQARTGNKKQGKQINPEKYLA
jgi:hypothetical protein